MKKPEERKDEKKRKKNGRKKLLPFLPVLQLVRCPTDFLSSMHGHVLTDTHTA
jgi:hypothetical protein